MTKYVTMFILVLATINFAMSQSFKVQSDVMAGGGAITATASTGGTITPSGTINVQNDSDYTFTIAPDAGYHIDSVVVDGVKTDSTSSYTFYAVSSNHTIDAYFSIDTYTITAIATTGGSIAPSGAVTVNYGADKTFTVTADAGYHIYSVLVDGAKTDSMGSYTFTNVMSDHTIDAYFSIDTYTITATATAGGSIDPSGAVTVNYGTDKTFTISADAGYHIDSLLVDGAKSDSMESYTFSNVMSDHTIDAYFSLSMVDVLFSVDMRVQAVRGNFNPSEDTVYVGGNFTNSLYATMTDGDNDSVYTYTYSSGYPSDTLWFKFGYYDFSQSNVALENDPTREYVIPMGGGSYSDYFDRDSVYTPPIVVNFNANMWVKIKKGAFDPSADVLVVSGDFNSWGESDTLKDADSDSIYSIALQPGDVGTTLHFKYRYYDMSENTWVWESNPDREYVIPSGGGTFEDYFNRDSLYVEQFDIAVTFSVNMELERLSGRFDPNEDRVAVRGGFNGWGDQDTLVSNALNPDLYEGTFTIRGGVGDSFEFKFWYEANNYESGDNRVYTFTDTNITDLTATINKSFNNGTLESVINQSCTIKFTCFTGGATSAISNNPFPIVNSVWIAGSAQPLQWPANSWSNADSSVALRLFDDGTNGDMYANDQIFSRDITFPAYTILTVKYKYGINWGDAANNEGGNDNEADFQRDHTLEMTRYLSSATAVDTFGTIRVTVLADPTGIGDEQVDVPLAFTLGQNYPNPFNPSTTITYSLAATSPVVLKVYDMLGREVETLVNGTQQSGTYTLSFSPKNLPSGIYYYRLTTTTFVETKTMMYVK